MRLSVRHWEWHALLMHGTEAWAVTMREDKIREARLRWYGHMIRREDEISMKTIITTEVNRRRSRD